MIVSKLRELFKKYLWCIHLRNKNVVIIVEIGNTALVESGLSVLFVDGADCDMLVVHFRAFLHVCVDGLFG